MLSVPSAVIFDMDGVLVDSEPLWRRAMIRGFAEAGISITEDECRSTQGTRFREVVLYWLSLRGKPGLEPKLLENRIVEHLMDLIRKEGQSMAGIPEVLHYCASRQVPMGLATSSSHSLMNCVLDQLRIRPYFRAAISAEFMPYGKPHPEVFLRCAEAMEIEPSDCLVLEDSVNGVIAARAAQMTVLAMPDPDHRNRPEFVLAHHRVEYSKDLPAFFKTLFP